MNKRPNASSLTEGVRSRLGRGSQSPSAPQRRVSRRESESRKQRMFYVAMAAAAALVILILGVGLVYEYQVKPNAVLASVNGHEIKRRDYWKYESVSLYAQSVQYQNYAQQTTGQQQQQFLQFAAQFEQQRTDIWGTTDVNRTTLDRMIGDRLYLDAAESFGVDPTEEEIELFALNSFTAQDTPLVTPIPSPTFVPERADAATETAAALAGGTPVPSDATPVTGSPEASPIVDQATPEASPVVVGTPDMQTALAEAESGFNGFEDTALSDARMSRADYLRLFAEPQLVRAEIDAQLTNAVPQVAEQIHAEHILVATEDLARQLYDQTNGGASFEELAKVNSTDVTTSATGGDLGWIVPGQMVPEFDAAAFALQAGQLSEPVQTEFGWHLIKVSERQAARPLTDEQYTSATTLAIETWFEDQKTSANIDSDYELNPTETPGTFAAPPNAPTPIPATPVPATPSPTVPPIGPVIPVATPIADGATPLASPVTSEIATPDVAATPEASSID